MIQRLYAILDQKAENYGDRPFPAPNNNIAIRSFNNAVMDETTDIFKHAEDFTLWYIGYFETENGKLEDVTNEQIASAMDLKIRYLNSQDFTS